jgi:hypothetical protein
MIKYSEKYPDPGPRPAPEGGAPALQGDRHAFLEVYGKWRNRAQDMTQWQTRKRQHVVACALDEIFSIFVPVEVLDDFVREKAHAVVWLSYLNEPLPEEFFP